MPCYGSPRLQYNRVVNVIPQNATLQRATQIFRECWQRGKESVTGSYDDAGVGGLVNKIARLYDIPAEQHQVYINWYAEYYPGTQVIFANSPAININYIVDTLPLAYARNPRSLEQIDAIAVHHFASYATIRQVHDYHISRGWPGIAYHFVIDIDGIYQTIPLDRLGTHVHRNNTRSIGVALRGNFQTSPPPQQMIDYTVQLKNWLIDQVPTIAETLGHRHFPYNSTACPGNTCCPGWLSQITD